MSSPKLTVPIENEGKSIIKIKMIKKAKRICNWKSKENLDDMDSFMTKSVLANKFQLLWVATITFWHTYHILSAFYFLGISDFPQGGWFLLQLLAEWIVIWDFGLKLYIMKFNQEAWDSLWLLHDTYGLSNKFGFFLTVIGSLPLIFIVACWTSNRSILTSFSIALFRIPKLLRFREIWQMSRSYVKNGNETSHFYFKIMSVLFSLIVNAHIVAWVWLIVGRIDPNRNNWIKLDSLTAQPSNIELYVDASFFVVTTMGGWSYGNILPGTSLEMIVDIFIMFVGVSMYANLFANFVNVITTTNAKRIEWDKMREQAINFSDQLSIPDSIQNKIK